MALQQCKQGHVFNTDHYKSCPYCNGSSGQSIDFGSFAAQPTFESGDLGEVTVPGSNFVNNRNNVTEISQRSFAASTNHDSEKTQWVDYAPKKITVEPVVGWLVCIEGSDMGKDFRLAPRANTIGRDSKMDVSLTEDPAVSRINNAFLLYDTLNNLFLLKPAETATNIYLNNQLLAQPMQLKAFDKFRIGNSMMVFVPLCCDAFQWPSENHV